MGRSGTPVSVRDTTPTSARIVRPSWRGVADAVGHCVLVFAFLPPLLSIPAWLAVEARNPLNLQDPVVLAFLPVRAMNVLLNEFRAGVVAGVLAGAFDGVVLALWRSAGRHPPTRLQCVVVGVTAGALAAVLMLVAVAAFETVRGDHVAWPLGTLAFELASGMACGAIAYPTAVRLLNGSAST